MDSERVNEIRKALDTFEGVLNLPPTTYELEDAKNEFLAVAVGGLRELLTELDKAASVVAAARELRDTPLPMPLDSDADVGTLQRAKVALMHTHEFQRRLTALVDALAAYDSGSEGGGE